MIGQLILCVVLTFSALSLFVGEKAESSKVEGAQGSAVDYKADAVMWLRLARKAGHSADSVGYVKENLLKASLGLDSIGTSEVELEKLLVDGYKAESMLWLQFARKSDRDNASSVGYVKENLLKASLGLDSIGTSEVELEKLLVYGYVAEAKYWLDKMRASVSNNVDFAGYVRKYLQKAGTSLESVGTSEEEISKLLVNGYVAEAKHWLKFARKGDRDNVYTLIYFRDCLVKAGTSLDSAGTSEEELERLVALGHKAEAIKWLEIARRDGSEKKVAVGYVRERLLKADFSLETIGSSEAELQDLVVHLK